jgi:outer membrane protein OmpA-like peptidoglycan-associated protein
MNITIGALCRALATATLLTFGATACMTSSASEATNPSPGSCDQPGSVSQSTPTVAVLGEVGKATEYYAGDFNMVVKGAEGLKARVIVNGVGSDAAAPSLVANTVLMGDGVNQLDRTNNLDCKKALLQRSFSQTLHDHSNPQPIDDFGAIKTLEGNLAGTPKGAPIDVVLFTSLLNTSQPVDLSAPGALNDPAVALNTLAAQRLLPDCSGWRVYAIGGDQQSQPPLDNSKSAALREFWRQYFDRCGGALVAWSTHLDAFPITGGAIPAADTTQVPVHREPGKVTADLAGDVLFDPGHAELRAAASDQLNQVLQLVKQSSGQVVVDGYTDVGGNEADNHDLSQRRCTSIQTWLFQHGVSPARITAEGHGSSNPRFANPVTDEQHQANRRVEVTIFNR